jgi:predicted MPP superfamily phosphohydrolase
MAAVAWSAACLAAAGGIAAIVDLSNRLFGVYRRTPWGLSWRVMLTVAAGGMLLSPLFLLAVSHPNAEVWAAAAALVAVGAVIHLLRPLRRGVACVPERECLQTSHPLSPGLRHVTCNLTVKALPGAISGLRLLLLSDLHCNTAAKLAALRHCVDAVAASKPDLVLVLGDLGEDASLLPDVVSALASIPSTLGSFCVRGNHDFEGGRAQLIADLLSQTPIDLLDNRTWSGEELTLVGMEEPWNAAPLPGDLGTGFQIALSHTPDNVFPLAPLGVELVVSGHTHGGHLHLPGLGPLFVPSRHGRLLTRGAFRLRDTTLYVTPGLGYFADRPWGRGEVAELVLHRG